MLLLKEKVQFMEVFIEIGVVKHLNLHLLRRIKDIYVYTGDLSASAILSISSFT